MFHIDESQSPILVIYFDGPMSLEATHKLLVYLDQQLDAAVSFGLVMVSNNEAQHQKGAAKAQKQWLQANRSRMGATCRGIAVVTQSSKFITLYKPIANQMIQRMYHCPGRLFTDLGEAQAWLRGQLGQSTEVGTNA